MKKRRFPLTVNPLRLAKSRQELSGDFPVSQMPRLLGVLADDHAEIAAKMSFDSDEQGWVVITLFVHAKLPLICQNDLSRFVLPVEIETRLTPVEVEAEATRVPAHYEPVLIEDGLFVPKTIVEDELLLHLPDVPRRPEALG